jgi:hypothetical protein
VEPEPIANPGPQPTQRDCSYDRDPLPAWTNGRLTLLGDPARPVLPHAGQGANEVLKTRSRSPRFSESESPDSLRAYGGWLTRPAGHFAV